MNSIYRYTGYVSGSDSYTNITPPSGVAIATTYDARGNLTGDGARTYAYDSQNRLTSVSDGGTTLATYSYELLGRLYRVNAPKSSQLWI